MRGRVASLGDFQPCGGDGSRVTDVLAINPLGNMYLRLGSRLGYPNDVASDLPVRAEEEFFALFFGVILTATVLGGLLLLVPQGRSFAWVFTLFCAFMGFGVGSGASLQAQMWSSAPVPWVSATFGRVVLPGLVGMAAATVALVSEWSGIAP